MNISNKTTSFLAIFSTTCILLLSAASFAEENNTTNCPSELVNFWKNYALQSDDPASIPGFLLDKECFRAAASPEFYNLFQTRLDNPEEDQVVAQMYAELSWTNGYTY